MASGKTLTDTAVKNAKPKLVEGKLREIRLYDRDGLYLTVAGTGKKWWRLKFHFAGKERRMGLGSYPDVSLSEARILRDEARALLRKNINPQVHRTVERAQAIARERNTVEAVARGLLAERSSYWSDDYASKFLRSLEKDIFPSIGARPVAEVTPLEVLSCLRAIEKRGAIDMAKRVCQRCSMVFDYAIRTHLCTSNPARSLPGALLKRKVKHYSAIGPDELPDFQRKLDVYDGAPLTKLATKLLLLTFVRTAELRGAVWSEIRLDLKEWRIPASRMKMQKEHVVPLSKQAVAVLKELQRFSTDRSGLVFPQASNQSKPMSENTILYALYRLGYHGRATGHGFRTLASTTLNEAGFSTDAIELQLAHVERNQVRASYNQAQYLSERMIMMQAWADFVHQCDNLPVATERLRRSARKARNT